MFSEFVVIILINETMHNCGVLEVQLELHGQVEGEQ